MTSDSTRKRWAEAVHVPVRAPRPQPVTTTQPRLGATIATFLRALLTAPTRSRDVSKPPRIEPLIHSQPLVE